MDQKGIAPLSIVAIVAVVAVVAGVGIYVATRGDGSTGTVGIDLENFREMARNETWANIRNQLFVIDNKLVFWIVEGQRPDAGYGYFLFGNNTENIICSRTDSIGGPQEICNDNNYRDLFHTMINNLNASDFGLGPTHQVIEVYWR